MTAAVNIQGASATVDPPHLRPAVVSGPEPAPATRSLSDDHSRAFSRIFIGPMPESIAASPKPGLKGKASIFHHDEDASSINQIGREHALRFFVRHGGRVEDWDEEAEHRIRNEMLQRWKESGWATVRRKQKSKEPVSGKKWVGQTFQVGEFLGVNVLDEPTPSNRHATTLPGDANAPQIRVSPPSRASTDNSTFVTAPSITGASALSTAPISSEGHVSATLPATSNGHRPLSSKGDGTTSPAPTRSALKQSVSDVIDGMKGRGKSVQFPDAESPAGSSVPLISEAPASPGEVLARGSIELLATSASAAAQHQAASERSEPRYEDIILRGTRRFSSLWNSH
jgi:hypothetical protein